MTKYGDWIRENLTRRLAARDDELSKSIVALYLLCMELTVSSPAVYLDRNSADHLPQVVRCFRTHGFQEGLDWIASLEAAYGMPIHPDMDARVDHIMGSSEAQRQLEAFNDRNVTKLRTLLPAVWALLDVLVEQKLAESRY